MNLNFWFICYINTIDTKVICKREFAFTQKEMKPSIHHFHIGLLKKNSLVLQQSWCLYITWRFIENILASPGSKLIAINGLLFLLRALSTICNEEIDHTKIDWMRRNCQVSLLLILHQQVKSLWSAIWIENKERAVRNGNIIVI